MFTHSEISSRFTGNTSKLSSLSLPATVEDLRVNTIFLKTLIYRIWIFAYVPSTSDLPTGVIATSLVRRGNCGIVWWMNNICCIVHCYSFVAETFFYQSYWIKLYEIWTPQDLMKSSGIITWAQSTSKVLTHQRSTQLFRHILHTARCSKFSVYCKLVFYILFLCMCNIPIVHRFISQKCS